MTHRLLTELNGWLITQCGSSSSRRPVSIAWRIAGPAVVLVVSAPSASRTQEPVSQADALADHGSAGQIGEVVGPAAMTLDNLIDNVAGNGPVDDNMECVLSYEYEIGRDRAPSEGGRNGPESIGATVRQPVRACSISMAVFRSRLMTGRTQGTPRRFGAAPGETQFRRTGPAGVVSGWGSGGPPAAR